MEGKKRNNKWKSHRGELQKLKHFYFIFSYLLIFNIGQPKRGRNVGNSICKLYSFSFSSINAFPLFFFYFIYYNSIKILLEIHFFFFFLNVVLPFFCESLERQKSLQNFPKPSILRIANKRFSTGFGFLSWRIIKKAPTQWGFYRIKKLISTPVPMLLLWSHVDIMWMILQTIKKLCTKIQHLGLLQSWIKWGREVSFVLLFPIIGGAWALCRDRGHSWWFPCRTMAAVTVRAGWGGACSSSRVDSHFGRCVF